MRRFQILMVCVFAAATVHAQTASEYYDQGIALKKDKNSKDALDKFRKAVQLNANYPEALFEIGWCSNDVKDYAGALSALRKARPLWPDIPKVYFELGYAFEKLEMIDSAVNCLNECLRLKSDYSLAYKELGNIAYGKDNYKEARQHFDNYIKNSKLEIKDYQFWYRKGFMENADKEYTLAKESLQKSLLYKQDNINTYNELGYSCNKLKDGDNAIAWFQKAMDLDPKSHIPYNGIAEVYRDTKKDVDMAMSWYKKSLGVKTDERKACFGMGYCLNSKGSYNDAITYLQKAIQQENTYTAAYVELGYSYYMTNNNDEALKQLSKALQLNPQNENARYYSGLIYINQKNKTKAQQMVDELKNLNSKNAAGLQEKVNNM